jgi:hypothetical protein
MSLTKEQQEQQREIKTITSVNRALDHVKESIRIRTTTDEARKDTPGYAQMVDEYQEQTFQQRRF